MANRYALSLLSLLFLLVYNTTSAQSILTPKGKAEQRIKTYIDHDGNLSGFYSLSDSGVTVFASPADKKARKPEFFVRWTEAEVFNRMIRSQPDSILTYFKKGKFIAPAQTVSNTTNFNGAVLKGKKIALDPGHMAGDSLMARIEGKCLFLRNDSASNAEMLNLIEGQLTLATALMVKEELEKLGATVFMTREKSNQSAFGISYEEWLKKEVPEAGISSAKKIFHEKFKTLELLERAKKINAFGPDLSLIIHYNVDETNTGWTRPGSKNFTMAFIGGNLITKNMNGQRNRIELLRMIITDDLDNSEKLAGALVDNFVLKLKVPAATPKDAIYLREESLSTKSKGVYSRNLALTRLVHGPLAYGESLYQDNYLECRSLCDCTIDVQGIKTSERVRQVADCYVKAVLDFYR